MRDGHMRDAYVRGVIVFLLLASCVQAKDHVWLRRLAATSVCLAQAVDLGTTAAGASQLRESNSLMANSNGSPNLMRLSLVKSALCGGAIVLARSRSIPASMVVAASAPLAAVGFHAGVHNYLLLRENK